MSGISPVSPGTASSTLCASSTVANNSPTPEAGNTQITGCPACVFFCGTQLVRDDLKLSHFFRLGSRVRVKVLGSVNSNHNHDLKHIYNPNPNPNSDPNPKLTLTITPH